MRRLTILIAIALAMGGAVRAGKRDDSIAAKVAEYERLHGSLLCAAAPSVVERMPTDAAPVVPDCMTCGSAAPLDSARSELAALAAADEFVEDCGGAR